MAVKYSFPALLSLAYHSFGKGPTDLFDHAQVFIVIMRGKQQFATVEFEEYAADRPHVAFLVPFGAAEYVFGRAVLSGADYVVIDHCLVERSAEVDYFEFVCRTDVWKVIFKYMFMFIL